MLRSGNTTTATACAMSRSEGPLPRRRFRCLAGVQPGHVGGGAGHNAVQALRRGTGGRHEHARAGRAWSWFARARPISKEISLTNFIANAWPSWRVRESLDELMEGAQTWEEQHLVDEHGSAYGSIRYYPVDLKDIDGDD